MSKITYEYDEKGNLVKENYLKTPKALPTPSRMTMMTTKTK